MKKIVDYFEDRVEFPKQMVHNPIPYGVLWEYVSSTYLNGFINYVEPIKIYLIDRYTADSDLLENVSHREVKDNGRIVSEWKKFNGTKGELKKLFLENKIEFYHTDLNCFSDDIIILAEFETGKAINDGKYIFFWFDCDVSDCFIGKFETTDSKEEVIQSLVNWLEGMKKANEGKEFGNEFGDNGVCNYTELPLSFRAGWVKF